MKRGLVIICSVVILLTVIICCIYLYTRSADEAVSDFIGEQNTEVEVKGKRISLRDFCEKYGVKIEEDGYSWNGQDSILPDDMQGSSKFHLDDSESMDNMDTEDDSENPLSEVTLKGTNKPSEELSYEQALRYLTEDDRKMIDQFFDNTDDITITIQNRDQKGTILEYTIDYTEEDKDVCLEKMSGGTNSSGSRFSSEQISDTFAVEIGGYEWLGLRYEDGSLCMVTFQSDKKIEILFENYKDKEIINFLSN